jgi:hypothetical protein
MIAIAAGLSNVLAGRNQAPARGEAERVALIVQQCLTSAVNKIIPPIGAGFSCRRTLGKEQSGLAARFLRAVLIFMLLDGSCRAIAQQPADPVAAGNDCPKIQADWTPPEQFVWRQVCAGEAADFDEGSMYGGDLDPRKPDGWGADRALSSKFLETILVKDPFRGSLTRRGVVIVGAYVPENVDLEGASLQHPLELKKSRFDKEVDLQWVSSTSHIDLSGSKFVGALKMNGVQINADLNMSDHSEFASVALEGAHIGGSVDFGWSKVAEGLDGIAIHIAQALYLNESGQFSGVLDLSFATIGESLDLSDGTFTNYIKLADAQIGTLYFGSTKEDPPQPLARWQDNVEMNLHNAKIDVIPNMSAAWPQKLDLNGFSYRSLNDPDDPISSSQIIQWFSKQGGYSAQPYEQLALVLQNLGLTTDATDVRYLGREKEREGSKGWRYLGLTSLNWLVGYGYYPQFAIAWVILLIALGALVLRTSRQGLANGMPYGIAYSFDMLLPLIKLREWHYEINLEGWVRYYFYWQKIAGWILASFLVAGLSGLTK